MSTVLLAPIKELADSLRICLAGIFVADGCRKEFDETPRGQRGMKLVYITNGPAYTPSNGLDDYCSS